MLNKSSLLAGGVDNQTHRLTVGSWVENGYSYDDEFCGYDLSGNTGALNPNALYVNGSSYAISKLHACHHHPKRGGDTFYDVIIYLSSAKTLGLPIQLMYNGLVLTGKIDLDSHGDYSCKWEGWAAQQWFNKFKSAVNTTIDVKIIAG